MVTRDKTNIQSNSKQESSWHLFLLSALYFSAIPQILMKLFKPANMPAIIQTTPDKLILFWTGILGVIFIIIIPLCIARLGSGTNLTNLKKRQIKGYAVGKWIYIVLRICGLIFFTFYFGIEMAGINQL